jgi:hypothetical protein
MRIFSPPIRRRVEAFGSRGLVAVFLLGACIVSFVVLGLSGRHPTPSTLWPRHVVDRGYVTQTVVAADFTGDGLPDVIANGDDGKTFLYVAPEWAKIVVAPPPAIPTRPRHATHSLLMDADGDGYLDYVVAYFDPGLIRWLQRSADPLRGPWPSHLIDDQLRGVHGLAVGDIDGDGIPDLAANSSLANGSSPESIVWYKRPPALRSATGWDRFILANGDAPGRTHYVTLGDVDGDGRLDAAIAAKNAEGGNWLAWWQAPSEPRHAWRKHTIATGQLGASNILMGDVNGDGWIDFVASRGHGTGLTWFEAPSWTPHDIDTTLKGPHSLAIADLDGDGDLDAAACATGDFVCAWFENDGRGRFTTHLIQTGQSAYEIRLVDMDLDGDLDVLIAGDRSRNVVSLENQPSPNRAVRR